MTMDPFFMANHVGLLVQGTLFGQHCFESLGCLTVPKLGLSLESSCVTLTDW